MGIHHEYPRIRKHHINKIHRHHPGPVFPMRPVGMGSMAPMGVPPGRSGGRVRGRRGNKVKTGGRRARKQALAAPAGPMLPPQALMLLPLAALGVGGFFIGRWLRKSRLSGPLRAPRLGSGSTLVGNCCPPTAALPIGASPIRTAVTAPTFVGAPPPTAAVPGIAPLSSVTGRIRPTFRERMGATGTVTRPGLTNRLRMFKNKILYGTPFMIKEPVMPMGNTFRGVY